MNDVQDSRLPTAIRRLAEATPLTIQMVEDALIEILDCVRKDQLPDAAHAAMHAFYDRYIRWHNHFLHHFAPFVCAVDETFDVRATRPHLLDLGCGVGTQSHLIASRGAKITGLDNDPQRIEGGAAMTAWYERQLGGASLDLTLRAADAFEWLEECPREQFDGCYTQFALAYMRPHVRMLERIDPVVKPGGKILFREFNAGSLVNRLISRVDWLTDDDYLRHGSTLGWKCIRKRYSWLFPRQLINLGSARRHLGPIEDWITQQPFWGSRLAASMTLVFQKQRQ